MSANTKSLSYLRSFALFLVTLFLAFMQKWTPADIAWSMWVASLVGGYVIIFSGIVSMKSDFAMMREDTNIFLAIFLTVFAGGFISGFILLHFSAFHLGHAALMSALLPMSQIDFEITTLAEVRAYLVQLFAIYWPFALLVVVHTLFQIRENPKKVNMATPYIGVVKNHIMIFIVAILMQTKAPTTIMYVLLFYYFFPVRESFMFAKTGVMKALGRV